MTRTFSTHLTLAALILAGCSPTLTLDAPIDELPADALADDRGLKEVGDLGPAPVHIEPVRPPSETPIVLQVDDVNGLEAELIVSGSGCGQLAALDGIEVPLPYSDDALVGPQGSCSIAARIQYSDGSQATHSGGFGVQPRDPLMLPLEVPGSVYFADAPPAANSTGPEVTSLLGGAGFAPGTSQTWVAEHESQNGIRALLIWLDGYPGYYRLPIASPSSTTEFEVVFPPNARELLSQARGAEVEVAVAAEDEAGVVGPPSSEPVDSTPGGNGDVQVSIQWSGSADVDLHVREPSGETVFYGNTESASGGQLDLDSNPTCDHDGTNAEQVSWSQDEAPSGAYRARVHVYDTCDSGPTSGTLTIKTCDGESETHPFNLGAGEEHVVEFEVSCGGASVTGRVRYEDFTVSTSGRSNTGSMLPARYVKVRALTWEDDEEIAATHTDRGGRYRLDIPVDELGDDPRYWIQVRAEADVRGIKQRATRGGSHTYHWNINRELNAVEELHPTVDLDVKEAKDAGALNMLDVGVSCFEFLQASGLTLGTTVKWNWRRGSRTGSYAGGSTISAAGSNSDPDEYDDIVMAHEFGHVAHYHLGDSDNPGGGHSPWNRVAPALAWGEGFATFFGAAALGMDRYIDARRPGAGVAINHSIESLPSSIPLGTSGNLSGRISEAVVAASLLDIHDSSNESKDTLSGLSSSIWTVFTGYLGDDDEDYNGGRGASGRDYIDFLDGWMCHEQGHLGSDNTEGLRGNVRGIHKVPYDFPDYSCD